MTERTTYGAPDFACDVVMKGGITSGVVYPASYEELSRLSAEQPSERLTAQEGTEPAARAAGDALTSAEHRHGPRGSS